MAFVSQLQAGSAKGQVAQAVSTQAAKNLKQRGVKFDLVNGKSYTVKSHLKGYGNVEHNDTSDGSWSFTNLGFIKAEATVASPADYGHFDKLASG